MMRATTRLLAATLLSSFLVTPIAPSWGGTVTVTNSPAWNGTDYNTSQLLGLSTNANVFLGQSFVAPSVGPLKLQSFTFSSLLDANSTSAPPYRSFFGGIIQWNQSTMQSIGPMIYYSSMITPASPSPGTVTFTTNLETLIPGATYFAFLETNGTPFSNAQLKSGWTSNDTISGGSFIYSQYGSSFTDGGGDLAFSAAISN